ncbi:hypothetical protein J3A83DRAFT_190361 [Scleroderma citrinum]
MRVSTVFVILAAIMASVLAVPAFDVKGFNALAKRNVAAAGSLAGRSPDIGATAGNVYGRDVNPQVSQAVDQAVTSGLLTQGEANTLLAIMAVVNDPQVNSTLVTALDDLGKAVEAGVITPTNATSLVQPITSANGIGSSLGGSVSNLLSTVESLLSGLGL